MHGTFHKPQLLPYRGHGRVLLGGFFSKQRAHGIASFGCRCYRRFHSTGRREAGVPVLQGGLGGGRVDVREVTRLECTSLQYLQYTTHDTPRQCRWHMFGCGSRPNLLLVHFVATLCDIGPHFPSGVVVESNSMRL